MGDERMEKICETCKQSFDASGNWQKVCKPCYAKSKEAEENKESDATSTPVKNEAIKARTTALNQSVNSLGTGYSAATYLCRAGIFSEWLNTGKVVLNEEVQEMWVDSRKDKE